jgi:hypothetical protein
MEIKVTKGDVESLPGSIGRKWGVEGYTKFTEDLSSATVQVNGASNATYGTIEWTQAHELGHVGTGQDMADAYEGHEHEGYKVLFGGDRWVLEVEAWMRALDEKGLVQFAYAAFMLDCLNSYRRNLPDVSDERWDEAVELIAGRCVSPDTVREYVPIEPDADEPPPKCMSFIPAPDADDESEPDEGDDEGDGQPDDEDGDAPEPDGAGGELPDDESGEGKNENESDVDDRELARTIDGNWLAQPIIDAVQTGADPLVLAEQYQLDPGAIPALIKSIVARR